MQTASIRHRDVPWIAAQCEFDSNPMPGGARRWRFFVTAMGLCSVSGCCWQRGGETYTLFIEAVMSQGSDAAPAPIEKVMRLRLHFERGQKR